MRFLDLDLDFFLNENAYFSGSDSERLGSEYKPWSIRRVQRFLEDRCGLSHHAPVKGRTVETHDGVLGFWRTLIESGRLSVPFEVIHIDAHPDLWIGSGMFLASESLQIDHEHGLAVLNGKQAHPGNYLTFAIGYGWVNSLIWVHLRQRLNDMSKWDGDARSGSSRLKKRELESSGLKDLSIGEGKSGVPFKVLPWIKFRTSEAFDYIALSRSPAFTPPESDRLIAVIEGYMEQI